MTKKRLHKILLVEDEQDIQMIVKLSLTKFANYEIEACSSGHEALDAVESFKPDLILMDMMMPLMDGVSTMKEIRKKVGFETIPVIMMTARSQQNEVETYIRDGALGVIRKPFNPIELNEQIRHIWADYIVEEGVDE